MLVAYSLICLLLYIAPPVENPAMIDLGSDGNLNLPSWSISQEMMEDSDEPRKKKYAKEAWPGKKPSHLLV